MLKLLVRKQLMEVFKGYFYDAKKNKARSKAGIAAWIVFFVVIMAGVLGGMFIGLSLSLCEGMTEAGMGWLYFAIMAGIAILLGAFGSVFNTYTGLYLSKDNDLLLSMPIPVRDIILSRLVNVYILGAMYSVVAIIPALIVYWITVGVSFARVICGLLLAVIVTVIVLILSCLLGWCVAKLSQKLTKKSFLKVLASLAFIGAYYFFYFRAQELINQLLANAGEYGEKIKGSAYFIYLFGRVGEGDFKATAIVGAICLAAVIFVWRLLKNTFLSIATSSGAAARVSYKAKPVKQRGAFGALLSKELSLFTSNSNYMLNCGLGILFIPAMGVMLLIKGTEFIGALENAFGAYPGIITILFCGMMYTLGSMNDIAAPSVSLEGKSIWIPQSLPVEPGMVLRAKATLQLLFSVVPVIFTLICGMIVLKVPCGEKLLICLTTLIFTAFNALFGTVLGIKMPLLSWTNEIVPIKQSGAVALAILGIWVVVAVFVLSYFLLGYIIGAAAFLAIWAVIFAVADLVMLRWLDTRGAEKFARL